MMYKYIFLFIAMTIFFSCTPSMEISPYWQTYPAQSNQKNKKIVLVSGDEEYRSEEALPMLAKILSEHHGFDCQVLFAQDTNALGIIDPNCTINIMGLENLEDADLMILFTRFRALPDEQMQYFQNYLEAGKPIIGIRTATHAFNFKDTTSNYYHWGNYYKGDKTDWQGGFGQKILGINWHTHHGWHKHQSTKGIFAPNAESHPILKSIENGSIWGSTDVYGVRLPLPDDAQPLVLGQVVNRAGEFDKEDLYFGMRATDSEVATENPASKGYNPNEPMMPIIWTKSYQVENGKKGTALTSTVGASSDMMNDALRQMFVNAVYHLLDMEVPENANVYFQTYHPSQYSFKSDEYWKDKNLVIEELK